MKRVALTRREVVANCIGNGLLVAGMSMSGKQVLAAWQEGEAKAMKPVAPRKATPSEQLGPFYKKGAPNRANLRNPGDAGFPLRVTGEVFNTRGERVPEARLDVWQTDAAGRYDLEGHRYRAKLTADATSTYAVETVMPGHYDLRPVQHIHYLVTAPGHKPLVTQAYFATDSFFLGDPAKNYHRRNLVDHLELVRPVTLLEQGAVTLAAITFDLVLERV
jgi:protocatechuate 3,4-dioxygenase beta subunit